MGLRFITDSDTRTDHGLDWPLAAVVIPRSAATRNLLLGSANSRFLASLGMTKKEKK
jgi:hypothetical protein